MSTLSIRYRSNALNCQTEFYVHLPDKTIPPWFLDNPHYKRPVKVLILLHGFSGDCTDWLYNAPVADFCLKYNLAVVMPTGGLGFYLDQEATGKKTATFIGEELVQYLRDTFNIGHHKEDVIIGGFSMGGFGALHTALAYPNTFSAVLACSSALIQHQLKTFTPDMPAVMANYQYYVDTFGDLQKAEESDYNPEVLFLKNKENNIKNPIIYMACGLQDFLINENKAFYEFLTKNEADVKFEVGDGVHHWDFVVPHAYAGLDYLLDRLQKEEK
ncbi:MAG: hypothetical protein HUJ56_11375 [Erysipelotrichaceae bacterium]|nr:hypothetical protein [Erysipelotrichaceae bacterium]